MFYSNESTVEMEMEAQILSEQQNDSNAPQQTPQGGDQARKAGYVPVEDRPGNREDFGDDYEVEQEDEITREEAKTEKQNRTGKG